ncbi:hypothetical protein [Nibricoccus aquaticus]|uniref:hypothetical protein n=1 Tax=Nibricoccus aquaticus TaxID=2576891 RepID=UPI00158625E1|nr:hypothetical protein [Nibricoccus aquaticus]
MDADKVGSFFQTGGDFGIAALACGLDLSGLGFCEGEPAVECFFESFRFVDGLASGFAAGTAVKIVLHDRSAADAAAH